jgi:nucleotide-binding universal stress UspA family protein
MPVVLAFAYDGSLNGDWVAHYAVRFASNTAARKLRLIHVREPARAAHLSERLARIAAECAVVDVAFEAEVVEPGAGDVAARILAAAGPGTTVIAGTRARPRARSFLAHTVSARLLAARQVPVIAIRVVHPGVLGQPGRVLVPVAERADFATAALPVLRLLGDDIERLHLLWVCAVSRLRARWQSAPAGARLIAAGRAGLIAVEDALRRGLAPLAPPLDATVVIAADPPREIVLQAARHRARLICLDHDAPAAGPLARSSLEAVLRDAPADVAVFRNPS